MVLTCSALIMLVIFAPCVPCVRYSPSRSGRDRSASVLARRSSDQDCEVLAVEPERKALWDERVARAGNRAWRSVGWRAGRKTIITPDRAFHVNGVVSSVRNRPFRHHSYAAGALSPS